MSSHVTGREKTARCAHLLVKHTESRNPVSRRTGEQITMSKDHARRYLEGLLEGIKAAPDSETAFRELCSSRSDCGSYREAGDLGDFGTRPDAAALRGGDVRAEDRGVVWCRGHGFRITCHLEIAITVSKRVGAACEETTSVPGASRSFTAEDDVIKEPRVSSDERVHQTGAIRCTKRVGRLSSGDRELHQIRTRPSPPRRNNGRTARPMREAATSATSGRARCRSPSRTRPSRSRWGRSRASSIATRGCHRPAAGVNGVLPKL